MTIDTAIAVDLGLILNSHHVLTDIGYRDHSQDEHGWKHKRWDVSIRDGRECASVRTFRTTYRTGLGIKEEPTEADVWYCLVQDAQCPGVFEDWCTEYGYDSDSRKAYAMWEECRNTRARLIEFVGREDFDRLVDLFADC